MADEEIATRAPESDANADIHTESTIPVRTSTNENASADRIAARATEPMSDHCTTDRPLPSSSATRPLGDFTTLNSVECYVSKPHDYPHAPSKLLLLLSGGTGIHSVNNRLQADAFAARGFRKCLNRKPGTQLTKKLRTRSRIPSQTLAQVLSNRVYRHKFGG